MPGEFPGTTGIPVTTSPLKQGEEIFSFSIFNPTHAQYLEHFMAGLDEHLPEIILPRTLIEDHQRLRQAGLTQEDILEKARRFLQRTELANLDSSGELGQILLHLFASKVLGCHKLVSKFHRRESPTSPYRGLDSLYACQDESGNIYMLAGEAKVHPDANVGLRRAYGDLEDFWEDENKIAFEVAIAADSIRDELSSENIHIFRSYFIDGADRARLLYKNIIFVGYNSTAFGSLVSNTASPEEFNRLLNTELSRCFANRREEILASSKQSIYCFLPFEAVSRAREVFARHNGLII